MDALNMPRRLGPYTLLRRIAVGGMAEIYIAKTRGIGGFEKLTAIKLVHPHLSADPNFVQMLIDEAKILVLLTHANIAQVFDLGCIEDTYFIAMEYVDGVDAQGLLRASLRLGKPLPIAACCFIVAEMLNGLDYAHRKRDPSGRPLGIVHRDISPQNVIVSRAGEVKLVDFGIAKTNRRVDATEVGVIKGKYGYMSPEQAWADPMDCRSDVFSAGVMLYELLTGSALYTAKSVAELIAKVRRAEIAPPTRARTDVPEALSRIVMKSLAIEPSDRFQTALEMGDALRRFLHGSAQPFNGALLGRYLVELLEADEKLTEESKQTADQTGGLRALRRDEFVKPEVSVIFSLPDPPDPTRSVGSSERARAVRERREPLHGDVPVTARPPDPPAERRASSVPPPPPARRASSTPPLAARRPSSVPPARSGPTPRPPAQPLLSNSGEAPEEPSDLWTARWFAQQGTSLHVAPSIRMQGDDVSPTERRPAGWRRDVPSSVPPTLSWPPWEGHGPEGSADFAQALVPPRGEDPSLGPLPRQPGVPNFRTGAYHAIGRRELLLILAFVVLGAVAAMLAWDRADEAALELLSVPSGARVFVDGALQPGVTPLRLSGLRRGTVYKIRVQQPGYRTHEASYRAGPGTQRHAITLSRE